MPTKTPRLTSNSLRPKGRPVKWKLDLQKHSCPNEDCKHFGAKGKGNLKVHSRYGVKKDRFRFKCLTCEWTFSERRGTPLFNSKLSVEKARLITQCLVEGTGIRGTSRVAQAHRNTVSRLLTKTGVHAEKLSEELLRDLSVKELQIDELRTYIWKKPKNVTRQDRALRYDAGIVWVFGAIDADTKLLVFTMTARDVDIERCERFLAHTFARLAQPSSPLIATDMRIAYDEAIRRVTGGKGYKYVQIESHGFNPERYKAKRKLRRRRLKGSKKQIDEHFKKSQKSREINTAYIERFWLTLRTDLKRLNRQTNCISQGRKQLKWHVDLYGFYYNFVKTHGSLRTKTGKRKKKWNQKTPAMVAGVTDHRWSIEEFLRYRL